MAKVAKKTAKKAPAKSAAPAAKKPKMPTAAAGKAMTKTEIANYMAETVGITKQQAKQFFEAQAELAYHQAKKNEKGFTVPGLGKLVVRKRAARTMVMPFGPDKGKTKKIPAKKALKFTISKQAKDNVL